MIIHRFRGDAGIGQEAVERFLQRTQVALNPQIKIQDELAISVKEESIGLPDRNTEQIGPARRPDHGLDDFGIGDEDIDSIDRQIDHGRLAQRQKQALGNRTIARFADIDLHRIAALAAGRLRQRGRSHRQSGEQEQGADHHLKPQLSSARAMVCECP